MPDPECPICGSDDPRTVDAVHPTKGDTRRYIWTAEGEGEPHWHCPDPFHNPAPDPPADRCPTCGSPNRERRPKLTRGEVVDGFKQTWPCPDPFHRKNRAAPDPPTEHPEGLMKRIADLTTDVGPLTRDDLLRVKDAWDRENRPPPAEHRPVHSASEAIKLRELAAEHRGGSKGNAMTACLTAFSNVRGGRWVRGAPTHVFAEFLNELEARGWELRRMDEE